MRKNQIASFTVSLGILACGVVRTATAAIAKGDFAIVRMNASGSPDNFSIVALRDIAASETLHFTDDGWTQPTGGAFRGAEGAGTADIINGASIAAGTVLDVNTSSLNATGEQLFLFTGTKAAPGLVYGVDWGNTQGWDAAGTDTSTSALPDELGSTFAPSFGANPAYVYSGTLSGTAGQLIASIANTGNWSVVSTTGTTDTQSWSRGAFTVTPAPEPSSLGFIVAGASVLLGSRRRRAERQSA